MEEINFPGGEKDGEGHPWPLHSARAAFFRLNEDLLTTIRSRTKMLSKLKEFRRPVRIIFGDADPYLNKGVAQRFHEIFPTSELFLVPGARHFVQMDEPARVARLILAAPAAEAGGGII